MWGQWGHNSETCYLLIVYPGGLNAVWGMLHKAEGPLCRLMSNTAEKNQCVYCKSPIFLFFDRFEPQMNFNLDAPAMINSFLKTLSIDTKFDGEICIYRSLEIFVCNFKIDSLHRSQNLINISKKGLKVKCKNLTISIFRFAFFPPPFQHLAVGPRFKLKKKSFPISPIILKSTH